MRLVIVRPGRKVFLPLSLGRGGIKSFSFRQPGQTPNNGKTSWLLTSKGLPLYWPLLRVAEKKRKGHQLNQMQELANEVEYPESKKFNDERLLG